MRKNKRYYFKKENFLSISNLLYRLKSNAVSLATITILCSGVILTISVSYSIGQGLKNAKIDYDYQMIASLDEFVMEERKINHQIVFGVNPQGQLPHNLSILTITSKAYFEKIEIAGKTYKVKYVEDKSDKRIALDKTFVITKDFNKSKRRSRLI